jgi:hypothetical protein
MLAGGSNPAAQHDPVRFRTLNGQLKAVVRAELLYHTQFICSPLKDQMQTPTS